MLETTDMVIKIARNKSPSGRRTMANYEKDEAIKLFEGATKEETGRTV